MSQAPKPEGLRKLEWFGLVSGLVGLIADGITLLTLFSNVQNSHISPTPNFNIISFNLWLITFFGISYTVLIASYYIRRILKRKYWQYRKRVSALAVSDKRRRATERAITAITSLVAMPLFLLHFLLLFYIIRGYIISLDAEQLNRLVGERDATSVIHLLGGAWVILSPLISYIITISLEQLADTIYTALKK